ncbi:probable G-protein coupled receptor 139 [Pomacea canaliculata]|nr:probable G-protein coupled receptor 139 [Pomacea canaliculata]
MTNDSLEELTPPFPIEDLHEFHKWYSGVHGYLSQLVCLFGIPMNLINITVLTRKHMHTPINCILTWLALSDMLTMASYVPFAFHFYCFHSPWSVSAEKNTKGWMQFMIFHINFSATTHTVSIWLGVTLAIFRYKHIYSPAKGNLTRIRRLVRARLAVVVVTVLSVIGLIPNYLTNQLIPVMANNQTFWVIEDLHLATPDTKPIVLLNLWLYSLLAKFLPCVLMVVYGGLLLTTLRASLRQKLRRMSTVSVCTPGSSRPGTDNSRTTRMLLVVIVLFVVTELPQAVLIFLSVTWRGFFIHVYIPLGDLMDMLALINNGVNFVLYCSMSRDFRKTLVNIIRPGRPGADFYGRRLSAPSATTRSSGQGGVSANGLCTPHCGESERSHSILIVKLSGESFVDATKT